MTAEGQRLVSGGANLLKGDNQLPTFDAESKSAKIPKSHHGAGGEGGMVVTNFQLLRLNPNLLKSQSPIMISVCVCVFGGGGGDQLSTFEAESKSAKIPKSHYDICVYVCVCVLGGGGDQLSTFDAKFKSAKIPKSHYGGEGAGGSGW